jgi:hypothetical protein
MINPVSNATQGQPPVQSTASQQAAAPKPQPAPAPQPAATVHISAAAQALQEAIETPAQTLKEANTGDLQAKRLLAREAAAHASE